MGYIMAKYYFTALMKLYSYYNKLKCNTDRWTVDGELVIMTGE